MNCEVKTLEIHCDDFSGTSSDAAKVMLTLKDVNIYYLLTQIPKKLMKEYINGDV